MLYGRKVTVLDYSQARNDFYIFYRIHYGEWPDKNPNLSAEQRDQAIFQRLLLERKAGDLGIHINEDQVLTSANEVLQSFGRNGQTVPVDAFVKQLLAPEGLGADDFERFIRTDLAIQQLVQALGLAGELITPQEAAAAYQRERQEVSAQVVFFSASNYLASIPVTPAAVAQFYTNYLAAYRLPDRVQVSYVAFEVTNYVARAKAEWAKTNFDEVIEGTYRQVGPDYFPDAKTPEAAKAKIRDLLIQRRAMGEASQAANDFANDVFATNNPGNLAIVARQKGLAVHTTAPFGSAYGPQEFEAPADFTKAAFALTPDEPFAGPLGGSDAVYVMALIRQLPSEIPPFSQIGARVTEDYRFRQATLFAQHIGTNFVNTLAAKMAAGHAFASVCVASGLSPVALPPFSLSTRELPELGGRVDFGLLKQAAVTTPVGATSGFVDTGDGGFVLYLQSKLPVDQAVMAADMPQFMVSLRRTRIDEAFNEWLRGEVGREFRKVPLLNRQASGGTTAP
jgi:hypothetical protein